MPDRERRKARLQANSSHGFARYHPQLRSKCLDAGGFCGEHGFVRGSESERQFRIRGVGRRRLRAMDVQSELLKPGKSGPRASRKAYDLKCLLHHAESMALPSRLRQQGDFMLRPIITGCALAVLGILAIGCDSKEPEVGPPLNPSGIKPDATTTGAADK